MGEAFLDYKKGGSGLDINGIIEDYYVYAGEKVNAGDFVEFINGVADKVDCGESSPVYPSAVQNMGERPRAVTLDDNRVLVLHRYGSNAYLYGMVCTIEGASIVLGADTAIEEVKGAGSYISPIVLPNGLVLVLNGYSSANFKLRGVLISINGTTISLVTTTQIYGGSYCYNHSPVLISDNKVFVAFSTGSSEYLYGIVLTVTQTSISAGTALELNNASGSGSHISAEVLDNGDVFIAHSYSALQLYCTICGIEGTVVTKKTYTLLSTATYASSSLSTTKLKNGDIFIAHCYGTDYHLYGMVCKVNGTTVTKGTDTVISTVSDTARNGENKLCSILLDNGDVFIAHNHNGTSGTCYLYGVVCSVNDTTITVHEDVQLSAMRFSGWYNSATKLKNGNIFIAHSYNQSYMYLSTQLFGVDEANKVPTKQIIDTTYETQVRPATSMPCNGVASTSGMGAYRVVEYTVAEGESVSKGETVEISEEAVTGDVISKTWTEVTADTEYVAEDGTILYVDTATNSSYHLATDAFDGSESTYWIAHRGLTAQLRLKFPERKKVTKMKLRVAATNGKINGITIQGGSDNISWTTLYSATSAIAPLTEVVLSNTNFYQYYKLGVTNSSDDSVEVYEWQVSEYCKEVVKKSTSSSYTALQSGTSGDTIQIKLPISNEESTGHKDIVSIYKPPYSIYNLVKNGDFSNGLEGWTIQQASYGTSDIVEENGEKVLRVKATNTGQTAIIGVKQNLSSLNTQHMYYLCADIKFTAGGEGSEANTICGVNFNSFWLLGGNNATSDWSFYSKLYSINSKYSYNDISVGIYVQSLNDIGYFKNVKLYDLTAIFGAGNEPTQEWCDANL